LGKEEFESQSAPGVADGEADDRVRGKEGQRGRIQQRLAAASSQHAVELLEELAGIQRAGLIQ